MANCKKTRISFAVIQKVRTIAPHVSNGGRHIRKRVRFISWWWNWTLRNLGILNHEMTSWKRKERYRSLSTVLCYIHSSCCRQIRRRCEQNFSILFSRVVQYPPSENSISGSHLSFVSYPENSFYCMFPWAWETLNFQI